MIQRILLALSAPTRFRSLANWTIKLAARFSAQLFAVYFLPDYKLPGESPGQEKKFPISRKPSIQEEKAWQVLYQIEDEAFEHNIRISLILEIGDQFERLRELCHSYQIDLVVVSAESTLPLEKLLWHSPKPIIIYKSDKEE